jgi:sigma-B regulation protein RsbU (phosphoserine phosphatase)
MWTTHMVGLIGTHAATNMEPAAITSRINQDLCRLRGVAPLSSLFLAQLDPLTGRLNYSNAGHPPALLLRADGTLEPLSEGGPLLGVLPTAYFGSGSLQMGKGDVLVVCSDGILESMNNADQEFGSERLEALLRDARSGPADALLFSILGAVQDFAAARPLVDDISLVVVSNRVH